MLETYRQHVADRAALGIPPLPLTATQTGEVIELLKNPPVGESEFLLDLLTNRVPAGVDDAAFVKASLALPHFVRKVVDRTVKGQQLAVVASGAESRASAGVVADACGRP